ncbi:MAG: polyprenyl synthetase family protein [Bacteroidetes bacterium]|nr:polyprenyl synthetase family protein [Bacteroidota bacterium]
MQTFDTLSGIFNERFSKNHFNISPESLYEPCNYFLSLGGKRVRPVICLMGHELFEPIGEDAWNAATAIELFHNFTLVHDDIMDDAALRRGQQTVHSKYSSSTALLAGDVMMVAAYQYLSKIKVNTLKPILQIFNKTAIEVCEGQQLDIDFEKKDRVSLKDYIQMITLKTSVLLAASIKIGAVLGGASEGNCNHLYEFGRNLGIAFQIQDDYLDAFGNPEKFGKEPGGDIRQNKKTALLVYAMENSTEKGKKELQDLLHTDPESKVANVLQFFRNCGVDAWAKELKQQYMDTALFHLEETAVISSRKKNLTDLAEFLVQRDY